MQSAKKFFSSNSFQMFTTLEMFLKVAKKKWRVKHDLRTEGFSFFPTFFFLNFNFGRGGQTRGESCLTPTMWHAAVKYTNCAAAALRHIGFFLPFFKMRRCKTLI